MKRRTRTVAALVLLVSLGLVAGLLGPGERPGPSLQAEAAVATPAQPDVVVVVTDDQTAGSLPHDPPAMPYLQGRLEDSSSHWVQFGNAYVNVSLCCPARATTLSGQYAHNSDVSLNAHARTRFDDENTLATWLDDAGYRTGLFGKYFNFYPGGEPFVPPGWDRWVSTDFRPGKERFYDYRLVEDDRTVAYGDQPEDYLTDVLAGKAVDFIRAAPSDEPLYVHFTPIAGHAPWTPAPRHAGSAADWPVERPPNLNEEDVSDKPAWVQQLPLRGDSAMAEFDADRRASYETLRAVDDAMREIVRALRERGTLNNSIIVFTSDHGHTFGEHRYGLKRCAYDECHKVPFAVRVPNAQHGTIGRLVTNADIAPTVAAMAGVSPTIEQDGANLLPLIHNRAAPPSRPGILLHGMSSRHSMVPGYWGVRTREWLYAELETGERELYDMRGLIDEPDPYQLENRASDPRYAEILPALSRLVATLREDSWADPRTGQGCTITGTPGPDVLIGTPGPDVICGLDGDDVIEARAGDDIVYGAGGSDEIYLGDGFDEGRGGNGDDLVVGGRHRDVVRGGLGSDRLEGRRGQDLLWSRDGWRDTLDGGVGLDQARFDSELDTVSDVEDQF